MRRRIARAVVLAALVAPMWAATAHAQGRWAVVVAQGGERVPSAGRTAEVAAVRLRRDGASVVDVDTARSVVDNALGHEPSPLPPQLTRRLARAAEDTLEHVAFGRNQRALDEAEPVLRETDRVLYAVGADDDARTHLVNLCLYTVRALLQDEREPEAQMRAVECLRRVPDLEVDPRVHPRRVRELVESTRAGLEDGPHATLVVQSERRCTVRVDGRPLAETPGFEVILPPGTYDVQVVCDRERGARVRRVDLPRGGRAGLSVDPSLSRRLEADEGLVLAYRDAGERAESLSDDAARLAKLLGVGNVLAVVPQPDRTLELRRLHLRGDTATVTATAELPATPSVSADRVGEAVTALLEGRELGPGGEVGPGGGEVASSGGPGAVGWLLGGVGVAGLATSWVLFGTWVDLDRQVDALDPTLSPDPFEQAVEDRDGRGELVLITGGASAAVLTAAIPFWMPPTDGYPWWSLLVGGAGAAAVTWGLIHTASDGDEVDDRGVPTRTIPLGPLVAMHGAPLLAVPITYAFREALGPGASASIRLTRHGAYAAVSISPGY